MSYKECKTSSKIHLLTSTHANTQCLLLRLMKLSNCSMQLEEIDDIQQTAQLMLDKIEENDWQTNGRNSRNVITHCSTRSSRDGHFQHPTVATNDALFFFSLFHSFIVIAQNIVERQSSDKNRCHTNNILVRRVVEQCQSDDVGAPMTKMPFRNLRNKSIKKLWSQSLLIFIASMRLEFWIGPTKIIIILKTNKKKNTSHANVRWIYCFLEEFRLKSHFNNTSQ